MALVLATATAACGNSPQQPAGSNNASTTAGAHAGADAVTGFAEGAPFVLAGCYQMTHKQDTALLSLQVQDTLVTGNLAFRLHEKDHNTGTIKGVLRDSLIVADYTFQSEGLTSVREVVFKIKDTTLVQAFGDIEDRNGKFYFRNRNNLQYLDESPFVKAPCKE